MEEEPGIQKQQTKESESADKSGSGNMSRGSSFDGELEDPEKLKFPRVWLVEPNSFHDYEVITEDIIEMRDCDKLMSYNYHMRGVGDVSL